MSRLIPLTALWKHTSQTGKTYYTGRLGEAKILMFPVQSNNDKAPTFKIMLAEPSEPEQRGYREEDRQNQGDQEPSGAHQPYDDSDLPF